MKPIIFSTPMVNAILAGNKTQTRRVVKPQPDKNGLIWGETNAGESVSFDAVRDRGLSPYGVGSVLWVRESSRFCYDAKGHCYKADTHNSDNCRKFKSVCEETPAWRPSIHMPREAARIFLRVTGARAERVQDISEAEAVAEGVSKIFDNLSLGKYQDWAQRVGEKLTQQEQHYTNYLWHGHFGQHGMGNKQSDAWSYQYSGYKSARDSYSSLWEMLNAKRGYGWDANPWVWVYTFERVSMEEAGV